MKENELESETVKSSEMSLNDIVSTIKDKQEEFTQMLYDYTSFNKETLVDVVET
jgi:hypothetical protein